MRSLWAMLLVGCGATSAPVRTAPVEIAETMTTEPATCEDHPEGLLVEVPDAIPSTWDGGTIVGGTATVTLRWCGSGTIVIDRMTLDAGHGGGAQWNFDPALARVAHGETLTREVRGTAEPSELPLVVTAHRDGGSDVLGHATVRSVLDPRFVAEQGACTAAGGTFAPVGLAGRFACDAPTHDAGQRCHSSADCEGACVDDHTEVSTSPPDGRTCPAGQEIRVHVGTCAAHTLHFGCGAWLTEPTTECVTPGMATRGHTVCVD